MRSVLRLSLATSLFLALFGGVVDAAVAEPLPTCTTAVAAPRDIADRNDIVDIRHEQSPAPRVFPSTVPAVPASTVVVPARVTRLNAQASVAAAGPRAPPTA